ncbi:MAG TPA: hypothetical protein DDX98_07315 [Bacteroidales bacterium]|jgi:hypothetical protein|nr:hypothetical protein [Bacteroidales bacterium]
MKSFLLNQYSLLESKIFRFAIVFGGGIFSFLFLYVFEPYGIHRVSGTEKLITVALYSGIGTIALALQFILVQPLIFKKYTLLGTILWLGLSFILIGATSTGVNAYLFNNGVIELHRFIAFLGIIFSINIIPTTFIVILHYHYITSKRLRNALQLNESIKHNVTRKNQEKRITIHSQNKNNDLEIALSDLIFMCAADNYVDVHYSDNGTIRHKLLRNSLSSIEKDLHCYPTILRCHKSYIVNKEKIKAIQGNAAGYKLKLKETHELIPVSRSLNQKIATLLN